jgi:energy-coupling factor transporter ATP-binding protein EcfA2
MSVWNTYPSNYREKEVRTIARAVKAGECISLVGLSGSGKSNLLGFIANRWPLLEGDGDIRFILVDCNRLESLTPDALFQTLRSSLGDSKEAQSELASLNRVIGEQFAASSQGLCLMLDRFDALEEDQNPAFYNNLRSLRDAHKYELSLLLATRHPIDSNTELAELFYANTIWLGPMSDSDGRWNVVRYAERKGLQWDSTAADTLIEVSWAYPSMLRSVCEAYASGANLDANNLSAHPTVQRRIQEFWSDTPTNEELEMSGLVGHPLLMQDRVPEFDTSSLTAKEHILLNYFLSHPNEVCEKDDLICAVWPEDVLFESGIRDDSLAQLVRRLRKKLEPQPSEPRYIKTVPGRGYLFDRQ